MNRITYIDAMRGVTMFLVVYNHVLFCSFGGSTGWSINEIFLTFRMPLFFFLSGFLMYKAGRFKYFSPLIKFIQKKALVQLFPTLVFSLVYALIIVTPYQSLLLDKAKCGYWFTFTLFFYFLIYAFGDYWISKWTKGSIKVLIGIMASCLIYAFAKYSLFPSCLWFNNPINGILGFANFQYFLFFFFGAFVRAHFAKVENLLQKERCITCIIIGFIALQLALQLPLSREWIISHGSYSIYSILRSLSSFFGIAIVFVFFKKNETSIMSKTTGRFLQYIGARTLDIYLLHLILIQTDLRFIGDFLSRHNSIISELVLGGMVSIAVIGLCLLISNIIRCSDTLAKLLFGKVIKS